MKKIFTIILLSMLTMVGLTAQELLAEYPLYQNGVDVTGNNTNMTILNAPFQYEAIYSNGIYNGNDPSGSLIQSPKINNFDFDNFSISIAFQIEEYPTGMMPVIMGGVAYRWMGVIIQDSLLGFTANDGSINEIGEKKVELNTWYDLVLAYNKTAGYAYVNLDGVNVLTVPVAELNTGDESVFVNLNGGIGLTFKGYWRFFKIFDSSGSANVHDQEFDNDIDIVSKNNQFIVNIDNNYNNVTLKLYDLSGKIAGEYNIQSGRNIVNYPSDNKILIAVFKTLDGRVASKKILH
jgi:hypothetical protein